MFTEKYRPNTFDEVVGNKEIVDAIKNSIETGNRCIRMIITGQHGLGKTTLARIIAKHLLKANPDTDLAKEPRYREIDCTVRGSIDEIRLRVSHLNHPGLFGGPIIHVFDECSAISKEAQNVFLKPLENCPQFNHFIFLTSEPEKIIKPLVDRLTHRKLQPLTKQEIVRRLKQICKHEGLTVDIRILLNIASEAEGQIRKAIQLLEDFISLPDPDKDKLLKKLTKSEPDSIPKDNLGEGDASLHNLCEKNTAEKQIDSEEVNLAPSESASVSVDEKAPDVDVDEEVPVITNRANGPSIRYLEAITKTAITSTEMLNTDYPEPRRFLTPFINEDTLTMIYAAAGVGKSWLSLLIAMALTRSKGMQLNFSSLHVVEQCGVVVIDAEMSRYDLKQRISKLAGPLGEENENTPLTLITSEDIIETVDTPINIDDIGWRNSIYLYMKNNPHYKVLILDNLSSLSGGNSESSREAIAPINQWLLSLKRLGIAVLIIHHSSKSGGYRGHSSRIDNLNTVINLTRLKKTDELHFEVNFDKTRAAKPGDANSFILEANPHPDNPDWLNWNWYNKENENTSSGNKVDEIMAYLMLNKVKQQKVAQHFKICQSTVSNCRQKAINEGYITKAGDITDAGRQFIEKLGISWDDPGLDLAA